MNYEEMLKKQLFWTRVCALACIALVIVVIITANLLIPPVTQTLEAVRALGSQLNAIDWKALAANVDSLVQTGQQSLAQLDVETLNKAIADLQKTIAPLARLFD